MTGNLRTVLPGLIIGAFALAAALIWIPRDSGPTQISISQSQDIHALQDAAAERLAELIEVTGQRPVFHASRKPVAAPEAPKAPEPELLLLGIISEDDTRVLAFVKISNGASLYKVGEGEIIGKWRVLEIGNRAITVSKDGNAPYTLSIGS